MASTIKLKNGSGAPLAGDLVQGEPALDLTNKRLYTEDSLGNVIEVGINPSSLTIGGTALTATAAELNTLDGITATTAELNTLDGITATVTELNYTDGVTSNIQTQLNAMVEKAGDSMTGNLSFGDNNKAVFGAGSDLQIYHDGTNSYIQDNGTGSLFVRGSDLYLQDETGFTYLKAADTGTGGTVTLFNDGLAKLATTATGIDVTGEVVADTAYFGTGTGSGISSADEVVVSGTGSTGLTIHSPDANNATLAFGSATDNDYAFVQGYYNSGSPFLRFSIQNSEKAKVTSTGIDVTGTVTADGLTVDGTLGDWSIDSQGAIQTFTYAGTNYIRASNASGALRLGSGGVNNRLNIASNGDISFYEDTGTTAKLFWDASTESLGIGTTSPSNDLHISTVGGSARLTSTGGGANLFMESAAGNNTRIRYTGASGNFSLRDDSAGADRVSIDSSGRVGIGTTSPAAPLHVDVSGTADALVLTRDTGTNGRFEVDFTSAFTNFNSVNGGYVFGTNGTERMRIDSSGNLLVGKTSSDISQAGCELFPSDRAAFTRNSGYPLLLNRLTSDGDIINLRKDGTTVGSISVTGSSTAYNTSSDYRLKENVVSMDNASDRVLALNPVRFNFIADPDKTVDGFLAHEAQEVVPEAVTGSKDAMRTEEYEVSPAVLDEDGNVVTEAVMGTREVPDYQGIDQSKLVPLLTKALQEALERISVLESKVGA